MNRPLVVLPLDERVDRVAVDLDRGDDDLAVVVAHHASARAPDSAPRSTAFSIGIARVVDPERDVAHAVAVLVHVVRDRSAGSGPGGSRS